jgi:hypothetical protein
MKLDLYKVIHLGSNLFLGLCIFLVLTVWTIIYFDMRIDPPIYNVTATSDPARPGGIAVINFTYTRYYTPTVKVLERWLICDNGTIWPVLPVRDTSNTAWPVGENVKATLRIQTPAAIEPNQDCYYASKLEYPRILLPSIIIKNPPEDVKIKIINKAQDG